MLPRFDYTSARAAYYTLRRRAAAEPAAALFASARRQAPFYAYHAGHAALIAILLDIIFREIIITFTHHIDFTGRAIY